LRLKAFDGVGKGLQGRCEPRVRGDNGR